MQNNTNFPCQPADSRTDSRRPEDAELRQKTEPAIRQGSTEVLHSRRPEPSPTRERRKVPDQDLIPQKPSESSPPRRTEVRRNGTPRPEQAPAENPRQSSRQNGRPRQVVVGRPKSEKTEEPRRQTVVVDSPDIDAKPPKTGKTDEDKSRLTDDHNGKKDKKFYFQRPGEISTLRKMLIIVFGLLFFWCIAPAFFHIRGIGVISSSAVMLGICLTAMFWHLIDRNWTFRKTAAVSLAALVFAACVAAFSVVSGMMLKASLTAIPADRPSYTLVVLGCKAHGDQPSWMLSDRLEKAYSILRDNPKIKCVVTGGKGDDEQFTEAYVMKKFLVEKGISPDRIYTEELSQSTEENLLYSKGIIRLNGLSENIVIVTDRFHVLRARIWAEKSGFTNIYSGCCETRSYLVIGYWFREMFGLARLYIFGV